MPEPGCGERQITVLERGASFGDIEVRVLALVVRGDQLAALPERGGGFFLAFRARAAPGRAGSARRRSSARAAPLPAARRWRRASCPSRSSALPIARCAARERRRERDHLAQMFDFLCRAASVRAGAVGDARLNSAFTEPGASATACSSSRMAASASVGVSAAPRLVRASAYVGPEPHRLAQCRDPRLVADRPGSAPARGDCGLPRNRAAAESPRGSRPPRPSSPRRSRPSRRPSTLCASARSGVVTQRLASGQRWRRASPVSAATGNGTFKPGFELPERLVQLRRPQVCDPEIDETRRRVGGIRAIARCRLARAPARSPRRAAQCRGTHVRHPPPDRARGSGRSSVRARFRSPLYHRRRRGCSAPRQAGTAARSRVRDARGPTRGLPAGRA